MISRGARPSQTLIHFPLCVPLSSPLRRDNGHSNIVGIHEHAHARRVVRAIPVAPVGPLAVPHRARDPPVRRVLVHYWLGWWIGRGGRRSLRRGGRWLRLRLYGLRLIASVPTPLVWRAAAVVVSPGWAEATAGDWRSGHEGGDEEESEQLHGGEGWARVELFGSREGGSSGAGRCGV